MHDVIVVGGGPAGISAVGWLHDLERPFAWCSAGPAGGTLRRVGNRLPNYPGLFADSGGALAEHLAAWLQKLGLQPTRCSVTRLERTKGGWSTMTDDGEVLYARAVLLATGTRSRRLGIALEAERTDIDVFFSVTKHRHRVSGEQVVVVGGGDAALEGALLLADVGCNVTLLHRGTELGGQARFRRRVSESPDITVILNTEVAAIELDHDALAAVSLTTGARLLCRRLFVRIGVEPVVVPGVSPQLIDPAGYIVVDAAGRTREPGLYAAGDVCSPGHQSVTWSVGLASRAIAAALQDIDDAA
ncbi:MAG: thioredoxin reductase (NADPH) [Bradymonadia bacterium]|jgi:thioredoxin reductase (NADPH)